MTNDLNVKINTYARRVNCLRSTGSGCLYDQGRTCACRVRVEGRWDGTRIKSFLNGYRCLAWDQMIDSGQVSIVTKVSAAA